MVFVRCKASLHASSPAILRVRDETKLWTLSRTMKFVVYEVDQSLTVGEMKLTRTIARNYVCQKPTRACFWGSSLQVFHQGACPPQLRGLRKYPQMTTNSSMPINLVNVHGTELLASDTREQYRQKIARITLDSMVQFVGLLDAKGTVLEINQVALDAVGIRLSDVEGKPFWTTFWWQVSEEINATLRESILRASQGEFVRWDTEIYGRAGGKETIVIDASLMPVKDEQGNVVFIAAEGRDITEKKAHEREIARQREELAQARQAEDTILRQYQPRISHTADIDDGTARRCDRPAGGLSAANRERLGVGASQFLAAAQAGQHAARLFAHRGWPHSGLV